MRKGYGSQLILDANGGLVAFATGADFCTEHECGSQELMKALTTQVGVTDSAVAQLRAGKLKAYPQLRDLKRIDYQRVAQSPLLKFHHLEGEGRLPEVIFGFTDADLVQLQHTLDFSTSSREDQNVAGAWDEGNFAIRVRGEAYVNAMLGFRKSLEAGHAIFSGTFITENPDPKVTRKQLVGVILGDETRFTPEINEAVEMAQLTFEKTLRLKAFADIDTVRHEVFEAGALKGHRPSFLHIYSAWAPGNEEKVAYRVNTGSLRCTGWYTKEALMEWAAGGYQGEPSALT
ncbi:hypothetical protein LC612_36145 [Nostoc sp. CHAB 5834]|nr:hypothetical protein [Nostoc sp. CHAB 5834]